jgi:hypothetical protein
MDHNTNWVMQSFTDTRKPTHNIRILDMEEIPFTKTSYTDISPHRHKQKTPRQIRARYHLRYVVSMKVPMPRIIPTEHAKSLQATEAPKEKRQ